MDPNVQFYYLGRFEIRYQAAQQLEQLPKPPTQKSQSLLTYLVRRRQRPHPRERLMEMFWGERPEQRARRSLSTALWHIRRCFPTENPIQSDVHVVHFQFPGDVYLDVEALEIQAQGDDQASLQAAVDLYHGEFLPGFYDDWIIDERYRLQSIYEEVLTRLMVLAEGQGQHRAALETAQRLLAADSLREDVHRLVMRVYGRLGRRNAALQQYQRCRETVFRELGAEPMIETTELYQAILDGRFEFGSVDDKLEFTAAPASSPRPAGQNPFDANLPEMLVGREAELDFLHARWREALAAPNKLVLVSGEAGVGKTQLVRAFAGHARQEGISVLWGRCYEFERLLPYQPIAEALRPVLANISSQDIQNLPAWVVAGLARLIPEVLERYEPRPVAGVPEAGTIAPAEPGQEQTQLFHAIAQFLAMLTSTAPALIVLDDLHWATTSTLELLHYLVRYLADRPVMLAGTYRQEAVRLQNPLRAWAAQLHREGLARQLRLSRLPETAVESWVVEMAGAVEAVRPLARRLYEETEGNPFFVVEMIKALFEVGIVSLDGTAWRGRFDQISQGELPLPASVREIIRSRVQHLPPDAQEALRLAAVLGREFDFDLLNAVWQRGEEATLAALDDLLRARLVEEGTGTMGRDYAFTHHKIQEVVYTGIPQRRRQRHHAQTAEMTESLHANRIETWASELAYHFEAGGEAKKAIHYHRLAAEQAEALFAWQEAERHQGRMLALLARLDPDGSQPAYLAQRGQILVARAHQRHLLGRLPERDADLAALSALAEKSSHPELTLQAYLQRVSYLNLDARYGKAIAEAEQALEIADYLSNVSARTLLINQIGFAHYFLGQPRQALAVLEPALAALPGADQELRRHLTHTRGYVYFHMGNYACALADQQRTYASHQEVGDDNGMAWAGLDIGAIYLKMGHPAEARQHLVDNLDLARRIGARSAEAYGLGWLGYWALYQGDYCAALDTFHQALSLEQALRSAHGRVAAEEGLGLVCYHLGDLAQARQWLEIAAGRARPIGHLRRLVVALIGSGLVDIAAGRPLAAHAHLNEAVGLARESECYEGLASGLAGLARASRLGGDTPRAWEHAHEAIQVARERALPACKAWGEMEAGLVLLDQGEPAAALEHTQRAVARVSNAHEGWVGSEELHRAHARVLLRMGQAESAGKYASRVQQIVAAKAGRITDPERRQRYLDARRER